MNYEKTGKKVNKDTARKESNYTLNSFNTREMLWAIIKRHKFALVTTWAILMTVLYMLPFLPGEILSLI